MKNTAIRYGLIGGILVTLLFLGPVVIDSDSYMDPDKMATGEVIGYSVMILSMLTVFFGVRHYRRQQAGTDFPFGKALLSGLAITGVASLVFYVGNVLLYEVIKPNFLSEFGEYYRDYSLSQVSDDAERDKLRAELEASAAYIENSYMYAGLMALTTLFIGIIISLLSAAILRRSS